MLRIILFVSAIIILVILKTALNSSEYFYKEKFVIVQTNEESTVTQDKFRKPLLVKAWLIQRVSDPTYYREIKSSDGGSLFKLTNELWYTKNIGDTLYFKHILKSKFFRIKK